MLLVAQTVRKNTLPLNFKKKIKCWEAIKKMNIFFL